MSTRANRYMTAVAVASLIAGVLLSRRMESGVQVETVTLSGETPALRFAPEGPALHPVALLAHGATVSKETFFCFGEALAAAGFECYSVDLPGHGASAATFSLDATVRALEEVARELGTVDVFVGHSMGGGAGGRAVSRGKLRPKLFLAVGSDPNLGEQEVPLVLLVGRFEEFAPLIKNRSNARVVVSPWSDHVLEPFDPWLVNAAVEAACAAVGKTPPAAPTAWRWRFAGLVLGMIGMVGLIVCLPELSPRLGRARGWLVPTIIIVAVVLTTGKWLGLAPQLHRIPWQLAVMLVTWVAAAGVGKLGFPRWSVPAVGAAFTLGCVTATVYAAGSLESGDAFFPFVFLSIVLGISTLILLVGTALGGIVARRGTRRDGDIAMAIFVGYAIGQWIPKIV